MKETLRQKRVASLIKDEIALLLIDEYPPQTFGLLTVTRVEITGDLKQANVIVSVFGGGDAEAFLSSLKTKQGYFSKCVASRINLKYNPMLFFSLDLSSEYSERIEDILETLKNEKK